MTRSWTEILMPTLESERLIIWPSRWTIWRHTPPVRLVLSLFGI